MALKNRALRSAVALAFAALFVGGQTLPIKKRFIIEDRSKLSIKGRSNVNSFACDCPDNFQPQTFEAEQIENGKLRFKNASIRLNVEGFDCQNAKIDHDLRKALRASEFPQIKVALSELRFDPKKFKTDPSGWHDVEAIVRITITDQTRDHSIRAKAQMMGPNALSATSEKALRMSEFGIKPPEAMFGLIKVEDGISICFDLSIRTEEAN